MSGDQKTLCATVSDSDSTRQVIELSCGGINGSAILLQGTRTTLCEVEVYGKPRVGDLGIPSEATCHSVVFPALILKCL